MRIVLPMAFLIASALPALAQKTPTIAPDAQTVVNYYRDRAQKADDAAAVAQGQIATLEMEIADLKKAITPPPVSDKVPPAKP